MCFESLFSLLTTVYPEGELLYYMVILIFSGTITLFHSGCTATNNAQGVLISPQVNFDEVQPLLFFVVNCAFGVLPKFLPNSCDEVFPLFFLWVLVLAHLSRSLNNFELICVCYVVEAPLFFFFFFGMWTSNFCQQICWEDCPLSPFWSWHPSQKSLVHICEGLFLSSFTSLV